jgi:anaerobic selenocysteine-containing dehydrogenase
MVKIKRALCGGCIFAFACPILAHVEDNRILKIEVDPLGHTDYPARCERLKLWPNLNEIILNHPNRLNYPMKRVGKRGEGKWQRITWSQAVEEISDKLKEIIDIHGPEAVALAQGSVYGDMDIGQHRFQCLLGTPNAWFEGKQCGGARFPIEIAMYGYITFVGIPLPGITGCMVFWGSSPSEWPNRQWFERILQCRNFGTKIICIDPRPTQEASISDIWLQVRPGSDAALAMAFLNVIINEGLYDKEFVEKYTLGFEKLEEAVKEMPPEKASEITWIPERKIIQAARLIGENRPVCWGGGGDYVTANHLGIANMAFSYYFYALVSLTGLDQEGAMYLYRNMESYGCAYGRHVAMWKYLCEHPRRRRDTVGSEVYPIGSCRAWMAYYEAMRKVEPYGFECQYLTMPSHSAVVDAILYGKPYPIKALISQAGGLSPFNLNRLVNALKSENLELFVVMDIFPTPFTALADYVLPAAHTIERDSLITGNGLHYFIHGGEKAVEPLFERRDDYDLWRDVGRRLGLDMPEKETLLNMLLEPLGMGFREFVEKKRFHFPPLGWRKYEKGLATRSGKVEYVPSVLEELFGEGRFPPKYEEPAWSPIRNHELSKEYNLILTSRGRKWPYIHTGGRWIQEFRRLYPLPLCEINPEDAKERGIGHGDWITIETPMGKILSKAYVSPAMLRGVVAADTFWYLPEEGEKNLYGLLKYNFNVLIPDTPQHNDQLTGTLPHRGLICKIYKTRA